MDGSTVHSTLPSARTPKIQGVLFVVDSGESGGVSGSGSHKQIQRMRPARLFGTTTYSVARKEGSNYSV